MTSVIQKCFFRSKSCAFIPHSDLKQRLGAQRQTRKDVHTLVNNQCTAAGVLLDNVGQTCGLHVSQRCRLNPPLSRREGQGGSSSIWNSLWIVCTCPGKRCVGVAESSNRLISDGKLLVFKGESPHREPALQVNVLPAGAVTLPLRMSL